MKKLYRSKTDYKIAGVCSGLGQYFQIDPSFIRLIFVLIGIFTAFLPVLIFYFILILVIPLQTQKARINYRRVYRSKKNRILAGVCGGIAEFFKIDVIVIRIIFIFLTLITAVIPMIITYIVAWIIIPENPNKFIEIEIEKD